MLRLNRGRLPPETVFTGRGAGEGSWEGLKATISDAPEKFKYTLDDLFARR